MYGSDDEEFKKMLQENLSRRKSKTDNEEDAPGFSSSSSDFEKIEKDELSPNIIDRKNPQFTNVMEPFFTLDKKTKVKGKKRKAIANFFGKAFKKIQSSIAFRYLYIYYIYTNLLVQHAIVIKRKA